MSFDRFKSPFPNHNSTLAKARAMQLELKSEQISFNPRIVINEVGALGLAMIPESDVTEISDFPMWAKVNEDTTIDALKAGKPPLTDDLELYYGIYVVEGGEGNFCCVGDTLLWMERNPSITLRQAVNVRGGSITLGKK